MSNALSLPAFIAYAVTALVLCLILLALWAYSGVARAKSGVQINAEDSALFCSRRRSVKPIRPPLPGCCGRTAMRRR